MYFPKYWAQAQQDSLISWRWSDRSLDEARAIARDSVDRLAQIYSSGGFRCMERYGYGSRPLREPVLREIRAEDGAIAGVITRNAYGSLVLNTARVMILDIDLDAPVPPREHFVSILPVWLMLIFGQRKPGAPSHSGQAAFDAALGRVERWSRQNPDWGLRLYRTCAGLRLIVTHATFDPVAAANHAICDTLAVDPLYRRLCREQKSFRARLTPKHWRVRLGRPDQRWPFEGEKAEKRFSRWEVAYRKACAGHAVCRLIDSFGSREVIPDARVLIDLHDESTATRSDLPLA
ncbi:MAG: hypothetical protein MUF51_04150 [Vicinamibacteria bacterium]|jgi:hypothetical protein|nr:hypothetical protein [Vicinamibacteria bacterium]